jgi:hypothetical protein
MVEEFYGSWHQGGFFSKVSPSLMWGMVFTACVISTFFSRGVSTFGMD